MSQTKQINSLSTLSKVCEQLSDVIDTAPMQNMQQQIAQQQLETENNVLWLDEALALLSEVTAMNEQTQTQQIITKIESFVSKASIADYAKNSHVIESSQDSTGIILPGGLEDLGNETSKKN